MTEVISVRFRNGCKEYYFDPKGLTVPTDTDVIVETAQGPEFARCSQGNHQVEDDAVVKPLRGLIRIATDNDRHTAAYNRGREKEAFEVCKKKIQQHKLEMKLVRVECSFDGSKILFFFTADGRVDFRELVKDLASVFRARIELRQIGVRDEAKMIGGLGICGRPFCCSQFMDEFLPVSIKMAKTQSLSLNPTKISGTCGRLMCCLKYEQDAYEDLIRTSPKAESFVDTPEGRGTIVEIDLLRQRVKVRMEDAPETISVFPNADIAVLRSGKAKKNDPPIPADLAPISGKGKRQHTDEKKDEAMILEPIRFRYSTESIVEEAAAPAAPAAPAEEAPQKPRRRRRPEKKDAPRAEEENSQPKAPREPREQKQPQAAGEAAAPQADEEKKPRRRNNHRRYRKPKANPDTPKD